MKYAENNRISHRQLYRQMILSFSAPFLLCLFGKDKILGIQGIAGIVTALVLLMFYVIFLIRLAPDFVNPLKTLGCFWGRAAGVFFLIYIFLTGAFLLELLEKIVPQSLVPGVSGKWLSLAAVLCTALGTHKGMQRRGRAAEVSGGIFLLGIGFMLIFSLGQAKVSYLAQMPLSFSDGGKGVLRSAYGILCAFSGIGLLPFALQDVEKQGSAGKTLMFGFLTLGGILISVLLVLPAVFGWSRLVSEKYPILPLLAGADMPGNILSRFDVLWMGFLLYGLLFSLGSLLHYGHQIIKKCEMGTGRFWMAAVMYILSLWKVKGYGDYLAYIFLPGLLLIQMVFMTAGRDRRRKRMEAGTIAAVLVFCLSLGGCAGVEPEERMYALAIGIDSAPEGFAVTYGTPDMARATGQEKPDENGREVVTVKGESFDRIEENYGRSQEKFMDLGHLEVLIVGESLIHDGRWEEIFAYLKNQPFVGENIYVFRAEKAEEILKWNGGQGSSVGEYLKGLLENDFSGKRKRKGITLRELYYRWYEQGELPHLPSLVLKGEELQTVSDA